MNKANIVISKKDARDARLMVVRQALTVPVRFLRSIVILPLLSSDLIFVLKLISTWLGYTVRANFGTFNLLGFYYPAVEAQGDTQLGQRYKYQAWIFSLFCVLIAAGVGVLIASLYLETKHIPILIVWGIASILIKYMTNYYQATGNFNKIAIIDITSLVIGFFISLGGLLLFGFDGYLIGLVIPMLIVLGIGKSSFFPQKVALPFSFIKKSLQDGGYLTIDGFLSSFVKAHEITLFAFLASVNKKPFIALHCLIWCCFPLRLQLFYWVGSCCLTFSRLTKKWLGCFLSCFWEQLCNVQDIIRESYLNWLKNLKPIF